MTISRFTFQKNAAETALNLSPDKLVLNVGCNDDPAHIKGLGKQVLNCDLYEVDPHLNRPNAVDITFDCVEERWPFDDDSVSCVILGDIVEHLSYEDRLKAFKEAHRVSDTLVVTCPNDDRLYDEDGNIPMEPKGLFHIHTVTENDLRDSLDVTGWTIDTWQTVDYDFVPEGYFVTASRMATVADE